MTVTLKPKCYVFACAGCGLLAMSERTDTLTCSSTASPAYLPKLAKRYGLLDRLTSRQFTTAMCELRLCGRIKLEKVGQYANRSPRMGFIEATA